MGEFFFRRLFLFVLMVCSLVVFSVGVFSAVHPLYSSFSSASSGFVFNNNSGLVSVSDTAVYKIGYYSVNGGAWQSFTLTGTPYNGDANWLSGSTSRAIPLFGVGEHYVIIYSCTYANNLWDCHDNRWQLIVINNTPNVPPPSNSSCGIGVCNSNEYCFNGACLLDVSGNTYFVSTNGNDNNPGTFEQPWKTWSKAFHTARAGDIVYFRGGTYYTEVTDGRGIKYMPESGIGYDGTEQNPIRYFNYPNEIPVLDCIGSTATYDDVYNYGLFLHGVDYVHIKGLQIKNVKQRPSPLGEQADICIGIWNNYGNHLKLENMDIGNVDGYAFRTVRSYYVEIINCDAHDCVDFYHETLPGQWGGGFGGGNGEFEDGYVYYYGCRAWNCSDQGMCASGSISLVVFDNCWSFNNGALKGGGIGWKLGYWSKASNNDPVAIVRNCIAANNLGEGFTGNENTQTYAEPYYIYNNFAYNSGRFAFSLYNSNSSNAEELKRIARNNIAYIYGTSGFGFDCYADPYNPASLYTHSNNSWDSPVTLTNDDFVSLDTSQLMRPRKSDGSLPDITFGHLVAGSDLIDKGVNVGLPFSGGAPDLGPFEYTGESQPTCVGSSSQVCSITNGVGSQSRTCVGGVWSAWSTCTLTSCNSCYTPSGNTCVPATCSGSSTQTCSIANGVGSQSRTCSCGAWSSWGTCTVVSCNTGYTSSGNTCVVNTSLGSQIIADHTVVDRFDDIPQCYIDEVKKMWLVVPGESHSEAYRVGLTLLEQAYPAFAVSSVESGTPQTYTTSNLRVSRATWGDVNNSAGWIYNYGEEDWYTSATAISRTKAGITYANTHNLTIAAIGFAWCYDIVGYTVPTGPRDPVYGCYWFGDSKGGPQGNLAWGLDAEDYALTGNTVCMDTYLDATQSYSDYSAANNYNTKVFFTTGPIATQSPYEPSYQGHVKHEYIRAFVAEDSSRILFDYADILAYNDDGSQNLLTWNGHTYPVMTATNLGDASIGHIGSAGAIRLAKAQWWMLARIAGWDGVSTTCS